MNFKFGLEQEYTIVDISGKPISQIDDSPSVDAIIKSASQNNPHLLQHLDTELYAAQLEIKTCNLCNTVKEGFDQIFTVKEVVESLPEMKSNNLHLEALPFIENSGHDIIGTIEKSHHKDMIQALLNKNFYQTSDIEKALTLASTQVNISGFFEGLNPDEILTLGMKMLNFLSKNEKSIYANNSVVSDSMGKTRRDYYNIIPHSFKSEYFLNTHFGINEISHFEEFDSLDNMLEYLHCHNMLSYNPNLLNTEQFSQLSDKLFHMFVGKIKKDAFSGFEMRGFDCTENILYVSEKVSEFLEFIRLEREKILSK